MNSRRLGGIALFLPLGIMLAWILSNIFMIESGTSIRLRVQGFDPRNLLSGHYLEFSVDFGQRIACEKDTDICLCLKKDSAGFHIFESKVSCLANSCAVKVRGSCESGIFRTGIERYYFGEESVRDLAFAPPNSSIEVSVSKNGEMRATQFFVGDLTIEDWLKNKKLETKLP